MQTYALTYLDDEERMILRRCAGIGIEAKDLDGRDFLVGRYLDRMAENRHNGKKHYENALYLIAQACMMLEPMSDPAYWHKFNVPHADLLAAERERQIDDLMWAAEVCRTGFTLSTIPEPEENEP
jgi:hypothetical protein